MHHKKMKKSKTKPKNDKKKKKRGILRARVCVPCLSFLVPLQSTSEVSSSSTIMKTLVATVETTSLFSNCSQTSFHVKNETYPSV